MTAPPADAEANVPAGRDTRRDVLDKIVSCFDDAFAHDGYADVTISLRIRRKGEKEIIVAYGKEWRFVLPCSGASAAPSPPTSAIRRPPR